MFPVSLDKAGPKHSTRVPSSSEVAVPLSVDEKEVALVPNPVPVATVKGLPGPQGHLLYYVPENTLCSHSLSRW